MTDRELDRRAAHRLAVLRHAQAQQDGAHLVDQYGQLILDRQPPPPPPAWRRRGSYIAAPGRWRVAAVQSVHRGGEGSGAILTPRPAEPESGCGQRRTGGDLAEARQRAVWSWVRPSAWRWAWPPATLPPDLSSALSSDCCSASWLTSRPARQADERALRPPVGRGPAVSGGHGRFGAVEGNPDARP
jgi:hypothetical protein